MERFLTARVSITGVRPFFWNAFTPDKIPLERGERTGVAGNDPEEWRRSFLATPEGQLYVEPTYVFGCCRDGAWYVRMSGSSLQTRVVATLKILDERVLTNRYLPVNLDDITSDSAQPVYLDVRGVKNPKTRGRNIRYRLAASPGWQMLFYLLWDPTIVSREQMEAVVIEAGRFCGIGDGRDIGFGRFEVTTFEIESQ